MTELTWDDTGTRTYETGVDQGVLYTPDSGGAYSNGFAWNGLTSITESPSGAESNPLYADNIKYLNLISAEQFMATVEAYTYPDEFAPYDGLQSPSDGVTIGQQSRKAFGLSYRTRIGNDVEGDDFGYKLHLIYGATASPSEKGYTTVNDSPEAIAFSWSVETVPVPVTGLRPTSLVTIDSTKVDPAKLTDLETILYGTTGINPRLPLPNEIIALFGGAILTEAIPVSPTQSGNNVTIPTVTGLTYSIEGVTASGVVTIAEDTVVVAMTNPGYRFPLTPFDNDWLFEYS